MEKALFDWPIVLQYDVKARYRLISRKFSGMTFFHPSVRSTHQKPCAFVSVRQTNEIVCCFCFVRAFSFQGHTKVAVKTNHCGSENHLWNSQSVYENLINFHLKTLWNCKIFTTCTLFQSVIIFPPCVCVTYQLYNFKSYILKQNQLVLSTEL